MQIITSSCEKYFFRSFMNTSNGDMVKHTLRVASCELQGTSNELKA